MTNIAIKSKTFNFLGTPNVSPAQPLSQCLEANARIVGVLLDPGAAGTATFAIFANVGAISFAMVNGNATLAGTVREWWAGVSTSYKDSVVTSAGPAPNTINGFMPMAMQQGWSEGASSYQLVLLIQTTGDGSAVVFYTTDPPTQFGETL